MTPARTLTPPTLARGAALVALALIGLFGLVLPGLALKGLAGREPAQPDPGGRAAAASRPE
ncbi:hypothetical protein C0036_26720 [Streptomyces sp. DJ]|nr:hypothetical protein C0036_26720 [Streptomyces sp. DJ]